MGVLFDGIKKLPAEHVGMEKELLLHWMAEKQMLEKANVRLNDAAIQVSEWFRKGIQNLYPERAGKCIDVSESLFPDSWRY